MFEELERGTKNISFSSHLFEADFRAEKQLKDTTCQRHFPNQNFCDPFEDLISKKNNKRKMLQCNISVPKQELSKKLMELIDSDSDDYFVSCFDFAVVDVHFSIS